MTEPIGYITQDDLDKLLDPVWQARRNDSSVTLWTADGPPSRAIVPVYSLAAVPASVVPAERLALQELYDALERNGFTERPSTFAIESALSNARAALAAGQPSPKETER